MNLWKVQELLERGPTWLDEYQLVECFGISSVYLHRWRRAGLLPSVEGAGGRMYHRSELLKFLRESGGVLDAAIRDYKRAATNASIRASQLTLDL